jgi:hypothetical protein
MVQLHPGLLTDAQVRQLAERLGLNPRDSRFDSSSGHIGLGRQLADHLALEPSASTAYPFPNDEALGCCGFEFHLSYCNKLRPRGAAWSARLPVTQEIVGSNPIGDASIARYANRQSGEAQTFVSL